MKNRELLYNYADERAKHMISEGFVGNGHGNYGILNQYSVSFDTSHPDARPTETVKIGSFHYCAYCSRPALSIQAGLANKKCGLGSGLHSSAYAVTGHTCVCKGAMDEVQMNNDIKELNDKLEQQKRDCENEIQKLKMSHILSNPNTAEDLVQRIVSNKLSKMKTIQELTEFAKELINLRH